MEPKGFYQHVELPSGPENGQGSRHEDARNDEGGTGSEVLEDQGDGGDRGEGAHVDAPVEQGEDGGQVVLGGLQFGAWVSTAGRGGVGFSSGDDCSQLWQEGA